MGRIADGSIGGHSGHSGGGKTPPMLPHGHRQSPRWSVFWDKRYGLWRAAEDDPDSDLYADAGNADTVIQYMTAHS